MFHTFLIKYGFVLLMFSMQTVFAEDKRDFLRYINGSARYQVIEMSNSLMQSTGTELQSLTPYSLEVGIIEGTTHYGLRVDYSYEKIFVNVEQGLNQLQIEQVPVLLVWGKQYGKSVTFNPYLAVGYFLSQKLMMSDVANELTGVYQNRGFLAEVGLRTHSIVIDAIGLGYFLTVGYKWNFSRSFVLATDPNTGFSSSGGSGWFAGGGLTLRF